MTIRMRLLTLVLALWLPAVLGFGILAHLTSLRERADAHADLENRAQALSLLVEREIDKRSVMATTLAASDALRTGHLRQFHREARDAMEGTQSVTLLVDATRQLLITTSSYDDFTTRPRAPDAPGLVDHASGAFLVLPGASVDGPVVAVYAPEYGRVPPRYNVVVTFSPSVIQELLEHGRFEPDWTVSVLDQHQRVVARSRDPQRWLGQTATSNLLDRARIGESGFSDTRTLDGIESQSFLTAADRYGWRVVVALPQSAFTRAAQRLTLQAVTASGLLLLIGLALALYGARRVNRAVTALRDAAGQLGNDRIPPQLATGVQEADDVSRALHEAGVRSSEATRVLEQRVATAVLQSREAQARLLEGQKHEAIGRLTGGLAHDFNNLLQTISTGLQMMEQRTTDEAQRRVIQAGLRASEKAADLVRQMLTFGRAQALRAEPIDLRDFLLKSQELTRKAVGERCVLSAQIDPDLPPVLADPTQLELSLLNLVFNARDALSGGGRILIIARKADPSESSGLGAGLFVCLQVCDDGPGMDRVTRDKAFEPYFTTKPVGSGSGLGLPQVRAFAHQSGGAARLDSTPGAGTTVSLILPACDSPVAIPSPSRADPSPHRPLRVLMIEDDPLVSSVVVPALRGAGHVVTLLGNGDDAIELLRGRFECDVLFTDVVMPGRLTGIDLVIWSRQHCPNLPAVLATGYTTQRASPDAVVLLKPYSMDALLSALQRAVDGGR